MFELNREEVGHDIGLHSEEPCGDLIPLLHRVQLVPLDLWLGSHLSQFGCFSLGSLPGGQEKHTVDAM